MVYARGNNERGNRCLGHLDCRTALTRVLVNQHAPARALEEASASRETLTLSESALAGAA